jgi:ketosteroid isomerase-like protein
MLEFFSNQVMDLRKAMVEMEKRVADSNQQLWNNQKEQNKGLSTSEEHVVLLRRVLNDALGGTTRVTKINRQSQTNLEPEEVQTIDWGWYGEQLHFSDSPEIFMNGLVLSEEEIGERTSKEIIKRRQNIVLYLAIKAAEANEAKLKEAYDAGGLDELLKSFLPPNVVWEEEMHDIASEAVVNVLKQRETARKQQERMDAIKERSLLSNAIRKVIAGGDEKGLADLAQAESLVREALPSVVQWTPRMSDSLPGAISGVLQEMAEKSKENDPAEVEAAKEVLMEKTKKFGDDAAEVIRLIESGDREEARKKMDGLEQKVKAEENEARGSAPNIPDGAAIFGGS